MPGKKNILICPLDWGIGHATRCVPVIKKLVEKGQNVIIGADRRPLAFLQQEFPRLKFIKFPGTTIRYPSKNQMAMKMALSTPSIIRGIMNEHLLLRKIVQKEQIDLIISDNRYGAWHEKIPSIFITHQIHIHTGDTKFLKVFEPALYTINKHFIKRFDICWIPDSAGTDNLSGKLSRPVPPEIEAEYIGPLSRFSEFNAADNAITEKYDIVVIISGPEPQRSIFEKMILKQAHQLDRKILLLGGKPGDKPSNRQISGSLHYLPHLDTKQMLNVLCSADLIISRPGYSTIMDLAYLQKKAVFVPTPGQTEQEYLGAYHAKKGHCICQNQDHFNLPKAIAEAANIKGFTTTPDKMGPKTFIEL